MSKNVALTVIWAPKAIALGMSLILAGAAQAVLNTSGTLWYTSFAGGSNVHRVDYDWTGGVLSFSGNTPLAAVTGADGILFLPNGNLAIGGQGPRVHEVTPAGAFVTTLAVPTDSYHLSLSPGGSILYSSSIPGVPTAITLSGGSLVGASAALLPVTPNAVPPIGDAVLDTIAWAGPGSSSPGNALYTSSVAAGGGFIGSISFTGGPEAPTAAATDSHIGPIPASHGLVYDPFSDSFISMGDDAISRLSPTGVLLETLFLSPTSDFDQGTVDGLGHIFAADNGGNLFMIDYSATGTLAGATSDSEFLHANLDDIAPRVGPGSTSVPDGGSTAVLAFISLVGLVIAQKAAGHRRTPRAGSYC